MVKIITESYNSPDFTSTFFEKDMETAIKKGERLMKLKSITKVTYEDMGADDGEK